MTEFPLFRSASGVGDTVGNITLCIAVFLLGIGVNCGILPVTLCSLVLLAILSAAIIGRYNNECAHAAVDKYMRKRIRRPDTLAEAAASYFGLTWPASNTEIKIAARQKMKKLHPDTSSQPGADLHNLVKIRDWLLERPRPSPAKTLTAHKVAKFWRSKAGYLGQIWGALFPSPLLTILKEQGENLWPRPFDRIPLFGKSKAA